MIFSTTPPTQPGLYWAKFGTASRDAARLVEVSGESPFLTVRYVDHNPKVIGGAIVPDDIYMWGEEVFDANNEPHEERDSFPIGVPLNPNWQEHQKRVWHEQHDVMGKREKLSVFINGGQFQGLPDGEQQRLEKQLWVLNLYAEVLAQRIASF